MSIAAVGLPSILGLTSDDPIAADQTKRDQRFAELLAETKEAEAALGEITKGGVNGYWAWKISEMRKKITEQVMGEMNLTPEKLAAMSAEERLLTEKKIEDLVEERLKLAVAEEMKRKQNTLLGFNATAAAILSAQDISATSLAS